jgi:uncharacterized repeat protein (TIGR04076 family)
MQPGDYFTVRDGDIRIPEGGYICLYALQTMLPVLTPKEREIAGEKEHDGIWRVHHVQCPDPAGRVIFKIEQTGQAEKGHGEQADQNIDGPPSENPDTKESGDMQEEGLRDLRVIVEEVEGKCTSGMNPGDYFVLRSGRLYIPDDRHFCLYALQAALPLLPAKQRPLEDGDWLKGESHVICPDPAGNVILRIERIPHS